MDTATSDGEKRILEAAADLFSAQGFDAVSVQRIAEKANVCKATVFHHFPNKQALYLAVVKQACFNIGEVLESLSEESCKSVKPLRAFASTHLMHLFEQEHIFRLVLREMTQGNEERGQALAVEVFGDNFSRLMELIRIGQKEGVLRADMEAADAATAIVGLNVFLFESWSVLQHLPGTHFSSPERSGEKLLRLLLLGMIARQDDTD